MIKFSALAARILCLALCLCIFVSCGSGSDAPTSSTSAVSVGTPSPLSAPPEEVTRSADVSDASAEDTTTPMTLTTAASSLGSSFTSSENGCYNAVNYTDGSSNLHYFNYADTNMQLLDVTLENELLRGSFSNTFGGISPVWAGDNLFVFRLGEPQFVQEQGDDAAAAVTRLQADGAQPLSSTFPTTTAFSLSSSVLWDGTSLYFLMWDYAETPAVQTLVRLEAESMMAYEVHRFAPGPEYSIKGFWEYGPVLSAGSALPALDDASFAQEWENRSFSLIQLNLSNGSENVIAEWTQNEPCAMLGDEFYFWDDTLGALKALNSDTGEERIIAQGFAPQDYEHVYLQQDVYDSTLRIQFTYASGSSNVFFSVRTDTGEVSEASLEGLGENVAIIAELEDSFLVRYSDKWVSRETSLSDKLPGGELGSVVLEDFISVPEYAMISKSDYWAANPNFTPITDLVYS